MSIFQAFFASKLIAASTVAAGALAVGGASYAVVAAQPDTSAPKAVAHHVVDTAQSAVPQAPLNKAHALVNKVPDVKVSASAAAPVVPALPALPKVTVDCSSLPGAVTLGGVAEQSITGLLGVHYASSHTGSITVDGQKICTDTQKWVNAAGQFFTVERLNVPPGTTLAQLVQLVHLPQGLEVNLNGLHTWESPLNSGAAWISQNGYGVYTSGSPMSLTNTLLQTVVSKLQQVQ